MRGFNSAAANASALPIPYHRTYQVGQFGLGGWQVPAVVRSCCCCCCLRGTTSSTSADSLLKSFSSSGILSTKFQLFTRQELALNPDEIGEVALHLP